LDLGIFCQFLLILSLSINHYFKNITPKFCGQIRAGAPEKFLEKIFCVEQAWLASRKYFLPYEKIFSLIKNKKGKKKKRKKLGRAPH
jgi:hypothetical protein